MIYTYGTMTQASLITVIFVSTVIITMINKNSSLNFKDMIKEKKIIDLVFFILLIFLLVFLNAYRTIEAGMGGTDAYNYKMFFENKLLNTHIEIGFSFIVNIIGTFTSKYSTFLVIIAIIMLYCMFKYININRNKKVFFLIFMLLCLYFESFNILRSILAMFISLLVLCNIEKGRYFKAIIVSIICSTIHVSAVILFPVIFINYIFKNRQKIKLTRMIFLIVLMCVVAFAFCLIWERYFSSADYSAYIGNGQLVINIYLFFACIFILSIKNYEKLVEFDSFNKVLIISLPVAFLIFPIQLIMVIFYRMIYFFLPIAYTLMSNILRVEKNYLIKILIYSLYIYKIVDFISIFTFLGIDS